MKKRLHWMLASVSICLVLGITFLVACQKNDPTVLRVARNCKVGYLGNKKQLEEQQQIINAFLEEKGKDYRLEFQDVFESASSIQAYADYDMVYGQVNFTLKELEDHFTDLSGELKEGALKPLYDSMPEEYWKSLTMNDHIYNTVRFTPVALNGICVNQKLLEELNLEVPDELIGKPLEAWSDFLAEIYEANQNRPFMFSPYALGAEDEYTLTPLVIDNLWSAHFQILAPFIGISYEEPEKGVQCVLESDYAKEMSNLWKDYASKGYLEIYSMQEKREMFPEGGNQLHLAVSIIRPQFCYSAEPYFYEGCVIYPVEGEAYYAPNPAGIYYYQVLIPQESDQKEEMYQFMNDMAADPELAEIVLGDKVNFLTPASGAQGHYGIISTFLEEPAEETAEKQRQIYQSLQEPPLAGFALDTEKVEEQLAAVKSLYEMGSSDGTIRINPFEALYYGATNWERHDEIIDSFVEQLYDAGLQDIIDEANRQIEAYHKQQEE